MRAYHSCTLYRGELIFFGGNYPNPDPKPDGCSNTVDIYNIRKWLCTRIRCLRTVVMRLANCTVGLQNERTGTSLSLAEQRQLRDPGETFRGLQRILSATTQAEVESGLEAGVFKGAQHDPAVFAGPLLGCVRCARCLKICSFCLRVSVCPFVCVSLLVLSYFSVIFARAPIRVSNPTPFPVIL